MTYEIPADCEFIEFNTWASLETPALKMRVPILKALPDTAHEGDLVALDDGGSYVWASGQWRKIIV